VGFEARCVHKPDYSAESAVSVRTNARSRSPYVPSPSPAMKVRRLERTSSVRLGCSAPVCIGSSSIQFQWEAGVHKLFIRAIFSRILQNNSTLTGRSSRVNASSRNSGWCPSFTRGCSVWKVFVAVVSLGITSPKDQSETSRLFFTLSNEEALCGKSD